MTVTCEGYQRDRAIINTIAAWGALDTELIKNNYRLYSVDTEKNVKVFVSIKEPTQTEIDSLYDAMITLNKWLHRKSEG